MTLKQYLILMSICTGVFFIAWFLVLFFINPQESGFIGILLFYLCLFFFLMGLFSVIGFVFRYRKQQYDRVYNHIELASRQSVLFSFLIIVALFFQRKGWLGWLNLLGLVIVFTLVELFLLSYNKKKVTKF